MLFFALDLLLVLVVGVAIALFAHIFAQRSPDLLDVTFVPDASDVGILEIAHGTRWVSLGKRGTLWLGEDSESPKGTLWPCQEDKVLSLLDEAQKSIRAHKKANGVSSWKAEGLSERECIKLKVAQGVGQPVTWRFSSAAAPQGGDCSAAQMAAQTLVFRTPHDQSVWEAQSAVGSFLSCDSEFWADPYVIPEVVSGAASAKRGELFCLLPASHLVPTAVHEAVFADVIATFAVYKREDAYVVRPSFSCTEDTREPIADVSLINYGYLLDDEGLSQLLETIGTTETIEGSKEASR